MRGPGSHPCGLCRGGPALGLTVRQLFVQADQGAQMVQIFDSWASELSPKDFDIFSRPYISRIIDSVRSTHPDLPITLFISESGGLLERMALTKPDCISIHSSIDLQDGIKRIGSEFAVQVCFGRVCLPSD